jgi:hypothetical protein
MIFSRTKSLLLLGVTFFTLSTASATQTASVAGYVEELAEPDIESATKLLTKIKNVEFKDMLACDAKGKTQFNLSSDAESIWTNIKELAQISSYLRDIVAPLFLVKVSASFALAAVKGIFNDLDVNLDVNKIPNVTSEGLVQKIKDGFDKWGTIKTIEDGKYSIEKDDVKCKFSDLEIDDLCVRVARQVTQALEIILAIAVKCKEDKFTYNDFKTVNVKYNNATTSLEDYINSVLDQIEADLSGNVSKAINAVTDALKAFKNSKPEKGLLAKGFNVISVYTNVFIKKMFATKTATENAMTVDISSLFKEEPITL